MAPNILEGYTRVFVEEHEVDQTSSFYQELLDGKENATLLLSAEISGNRYGQFSATLDLDRWRFRGAASTFRKDSTHYYFALGKTRLTGP